MTLRKLKQLVDEFFIDNPEDRDTEIVTEMVSDYNDELKKNDDDEIEIHYYS